MVNRKKRNQPKSSQENELKSKKQKSIASFFTTSSVSIEQANTKLATSEEVTENPLSAEPETNDKEAFFTTSMYTDEINTMISTVLQGEKHLLNEDELLLLTQYTSLSGTFFFCYVN